MAHMLIEWVKRVHTSFNATAEKVVIGEPIDVGDWEELIVQLDTVTSSGIANATDVTVNVQTAVSVDEYAFWEDCLSSALGVNYTESTVIIKITPTAGTVANGLRKWVRLVLIHTVATASEQITNHAWLLLKKRTP